MSLVACSQVVILEPDSTELHFWRCAVFLSISIEVFGCKLFTDGLLVMVLVLMELLPCIWCFV
jgi:hypothetical protein